MPDGRGRDGSGRCGGGGCGERSEGPEVFGGVTGYRGAHNLASPHRGVGGTGCSRRLGCAERWGAERGAAALHVAWSCSGVCRGLGCTGLGFAGAQVCRGCVRPSSMSPSLPRPPPPPGATLALRPMDGVFLSPNEDEFVGRIAEELEQFMLQGQHHR